MEQIESTANELLQSLEHRYEDEEKVQAIRRRNPFEELKSTLIQFFNSRIHAIIDQYDVKTEITNSLREDLQSGALNFDQKMRFLKQVASEESISSDSLMSLFRPTPGAPSILASNLSKSVDSKDLIESMYDSMSSDDLSHLETLSHFIEKLSEKKSLDKKLE